MQDWLRQHQPEAYAETLYTCVEISPQLAQLQQHKVAGPPSTTPGATPGTPGGSGRLTGGHAGRFAVRCHDAADAAAWAEHDTRGDSSSSQREAEGQRHCYILACEVLDNLPHDRVWRAGVGRPWQQTMVALPPEDASSGSSSSSLSGSLYHTAQASRPGGGGKTWRARTPEEVLQPLTDPLILHCMEAADAAAAGDGHGDSNASGSNSSSSGGWTGRLASALHRVLAGAAGEVLWLPTGCLKLVGTLHQVRGVKGLIALLLPFCGHNLSKLAPVLDCMHALIPPPVPSTITAGHALGLLLTL